MEGHERSEHVLLSIGAKRLGGLPLLGGLFLAGMGGKRSWAIAGIVTNKKRTATLRTKRFMLLLWLWALGSGLWAGLWTYLDRLLKTKEPRRIFFCHPIDLLIREPLPA